MLRLSSFPRFRRILNRIRPLGRVVACNVCEYDTTYRFSCGREFTRLLGSNAWEGPGGAIIRDRNLIARIQSRVANWERGEIVR